MRLWLGVVVTCALLLAISGRASAGPDSPPSGAPDVDAPAADGAKSKQPRVRLPAGADHVDIPLRPAGDSLAAPVRVNGQDAGWFAVDTGASTLVVDSATAHRLKLPVRQHKASGRQIAELDRLEVGGAQMGPTHCFVFDIGGGRGDSPVAGLIGAPFLRERPFAIDFVEPSLKIYDPGQFRPPPPQGAPGPFPLTIHAGTLPMVRGKVDGLGGWMMIDTGLSGALRLHGGFLKQFPELTRGKRYVTSERPRIEGRQKMWTTRFESLEILGRKWSPLRADIGSDDKPAWATMSAHCAGMVGGEQLREARLTFDYAAARVWARWAPPETAEAMARRLEARFGNDLYGITPLQHAVFRRRADVVSLLLERGPKVMSTPQGITPYALAAAQDEAEIVSAMLAKGADPDALYSGTPVVQWAAHHGSVAVVRVLLKAGADPNRGGRSNLTPLIEAATLGDVATVRALLAGGADVNGVATGGVTPLFAAARSAGADVVALLIEKGADVGAATAKEGTTPLMNAAIGGEVENVRLLLARGAEVNEADKNGRTPLMYGCRAGSNSLAVVRALVDAGADAAPRATDGKTAADLAEEAGRLELLDQLPRPQPKAPPQPASPAPSPSPTPAAEAPVPKP